jgi:hypothetical protein
MAAPSLLDRTWPPALRAYDYVLTLNNEEIAWEGLRRNPGYRRYYQLHAALGPRCAISPPASRSGGSQACPPAASAGGSIPFVDPALTALEAPLHWATEPGTPVLHAVAKRAPSATLADLNLIDHPCIRQVVIGPDHAEYLLIRTSKRSLTIRLTGHRASRAPVCLTFQVPPGRA